MFLHTHCGDSVACKNELFALLCGDSVACKNELFALLCGDSVACKNELFALLLFKRRIYNFSSVS